MWTFLGVIGANVAYLNCVFFSNVSGDSGSYLRALEWSPISHSPIMRVVAEFCSDCYLFVGPGSWIGFWVGLFAFAKTKPEKSPGNQQPAPKIGPQAP